MKTLETNRLILRQWREEDSADLYEYAKSELVGPSAGWLPHQSEEESKLIIKHFIEQNESYAIVLKSENKVIGSIGMHNRKPDERLAHLNQRLLGYVLNPAYWGQGIIPEAVKCVLDDAFNHLNLDLVWCGHFEFNTNSKRVIEKSGFNYQYQKKMTFELLGAKEITTLYYNIYKNDYLS
ncbi:MAG: GNAT family N-acetyltransferase [Turicibacter sp.]